MPMLQKGGQRTKGRCPRNNSIGNLRGATAPTAHMAVARASKQPTLVGHPHATWVAQE